MPRARQARRNACAPDMPTHESVALCDLGPTCTLRTVPDEGSTDEDPISVESGWVDGGSGVWMKPVPRLFCAALMSARIMVPQFLFQPGTRAELPVLVSAR